MPDVSRRKKQKRGILDVFEHFGARTENLRSDATELTVT
jgi:hypothetical protein